MIRNKTAKARNKAPNLAAFGITIFFRSGRGFHNATNKIIAPDKDAVIKLTNGKRGGVSVV
jgi:hypothetical protein